MSKMMRWAIMVALATPASADADADELTLSRGTVQLTVDLEHTVRTRDKLEPWSLAPDLHYGVSSDVTIGVIHGFRSLGFIASGGGVCLSDCEDRYDNIGLDSIVRLARRGDLRLAARGRLLARSFDPFKPSLALGVLGRWDAGRWSIAFDPYVAIGLANRDEGNESFFNVPIQIRARIARAAVYLHTGLESTFNGFTERWYTPLGLGASYAITDTVTTGAQLGFGKALGPLNTPNNADAVVFATWRFAL